MSGLRLRASVHNSQKDYSIRNLDSLKLIEIYKSLLENDTWQVPTLSIYKVPIYKIFKEEFWMNSFSSLPKQTKERWTKNAISVLQILILNKKILLIGYKTQLEK